MGLSGHKAPMDAYEHFGLRRPPFDPAPDAAFYFPAPSHAEALATLQYTTHAAKGGCVVVGAPGSGKTLLARMIASSANARTPVLWVQGGAQADGATRVTVFPTGSFDRAAGGAPVDESTLHIQVHTAQFLPVPPLLIVDCAEDLPPSGWHDVLAWVSREHRAARAHSFLLLGLPNVLETLAAPEMARIQRRIFRACQLEPLTPELTGQYIQARLAAAGGDAERIFGPDTIAQIAALARGNPALINQICDNALLEACGADRPQVTLPDVDSALRAMFAECLRQHRALLAPEAPPVEPPALPPVDMQRAAAAPEIRLPAPERSCVTDADTPQAELEDPIDVRLAQFEERLAQALNAVRRACAVRDDWRTTRPVLVEHT